MTVLCVVRVWQLFKLTDIHRRVEQTSLQAIPEGLLQETLRIEEMYVVTNDRMSFVHTYFP